MRSREYTIKIKDNFHKLVEKMQRSLEQQGFTVHTAIDVKSNIHDSLQLNFRNYMILGACSPELAYKAISLDSHTGLSLSCTIIIQEHENGEVEISAINPMEHVNLTVDNNTFLPVIAGEISQKLLQAIDRVREDQREVASHA